MTTSLNTLSAISQTAEMALFGHPTVTFYETATNTALAATLTPGATQIPLLYHVCVSVSADLSAAKVFTIKDGSAVLYQVELATNFRTLVLDFQKRPIRGTKGTALTVNMEASGAAVQTISCVGSLVQAP